MKLSLAVFVAAALLVACQEPTCACPPGVYQIRFMGTVTRANEPVTDAWVEATFGTPMPFNPNSDSVNALGHYEFVALLGSPGPHVARLVARWPGDSAVRDSIRVMARSHDAVVVDFNVP